MASRKKSSYPTTIPQAAAVPAALPAPGGVDVASFAVRLIVGLAIIAAVYVGCTISWTRFRGDFAAQVAWQMGKDETRRLLAMQEMNRALKENPENSTVQFLWAIQLIDQEKLKGRAMDVRGVDINNLTLAYQLLQGAASTTPAPGRMYLKMGELSSILARVYAAQGDRKREAEMRQAAVQNYMRYRELFFYPTSDGELYYNLTIAAASLADNSTAVLALYDDFRRVEGQKAIAHPDLFGYVAQARYNLGEHDVLIAEMGTALRRNPDNRQLLALLQGLASTPELKRSVQLLLGSLDREGILGPNGRAVRTAVEAVEFPPLESGAGALKPLP